MRKTIGTNPLDAVVPDLSTHNAKVKATRKNQNGQTPEDATSAEAQRPAKERLTIHIPVPLIERTKNAVFWTPGLTLADLGERALEALVAELERQNGGPFQNRPHELKGGRPMK